MNNQLFEETLEIYYFNNSNSMLAYSSLNIVEKLRDKAPIFFTVSFEDVKELLKIAIKKDSGHRFDGCEPFFIPNSYIEIHLSESVSFVADKVTLQLQRRFDNRGLNIFVKPATNEISHELKIVEELPIEQTEFYNEVHLKTKHFENSLLLSIVPH